MQGVPLLSSFIMGGFDCASQLLPSGRRLDLLAATAHDSWAEQDYTRLRSLGMTTARDGVRWHLVEPEPGCYNWSSVLPLIRAARNTQTQIIWDLWHYGYPKYLDVFAPAFVERLSLMARAFALLLADEMEAAPLIVPINEPSYFSWAGGETGYLFPFERQRGDELKRQLVRAAIAVIEAIREVQPRARFVHVDPLIHVTADPTRPEDHSEAVSYNEEQFAACDMLAGRVAPELGGREQYVDILGFSYYSYNQWIYGDGVTHKSIPIPVRHALYRPLRQLLGEVYARYQRSMIVAETGIEDEARSIWLKYVMKEVLAALKAGIPIEGVCWHPILDHPGWDDDRPCHHGLWGDADATGQRIIYNPLAAEVFRQQQILSGSRARGPFVTEQQSVIRECL